MHKVVVGENLITANNGEKLSEVLLREGFSVVHPCGGRGTCGKCKVLVDGVEELSCKYRITKDIVVELPEREEIVSEVGGLPTDAKDRGTAFAVPGNADTSNVQDECLVLDIGTTTLALALVSLKEKKPVCVLTRTNPQRRFGADVISRIEYSNKNSVKELQRVLTEEINRMIEELGVKRIHRLYASGNTTMLHIFLGESCETLGVAPYRPVFLERREVTGKSVNIPAVGEIVTLPSVATFVGADVVAGMNYVGLPPEGKYHLLIDLGTNAEIVLYSGKEALCTAAAAGPCFEGANISCGMSATAGAISAFSFDSEGNPEIVTIGGKEPKGLCGTGLVDVMAALLRAGVIDETGYMEEEQYPLAENVFLSQDDIRQFQLAKSAVYAAILSLMQKQGVSAEDIEGMYISGGFSAKLNIDHAVEVGLLPGELKEKCIAVGNSGLLGSVCYALGQNDLSAYTENTVYVDLAASAVFSDLFVQNMMFE